METECEEKNHYIWKVELEVKVDETEDVIIMNTTTLKVFVKGVVCSPKWAVEWIWEESDPGHIK